MQSNIKPKFICIEGASTCKTFTLMFLIQTLSIRFLRKELLFMAYIGKVANNINGAIIHSKISMPFKCKKFPSLNLEQLQLITLDES
jgi:hypothetical protein